MYVGCCGYCVSRPRYYSMFRTVELQETFYELPPEDRLENFRRESPEGFIFNMKAYQGITHDLDSPTWRRSRRKPDESLKNKIGLLRPTRENLELWEEAVRRAKVLGARVVVVQTPPSFGFSEENFRNAMDFFSSAVESGFVIGWEPRGTWADNPHRVGEIVGSYKNLIHVVDPFRARPALVKEVSYFRLHGIGGREVNYSYKYTDEDLRTLCGIVRSVAAESREVYVLFNNISMAQDSRRFVSLCRE